jgi:hypothetical protein
VVVISYRKNENKNDGPAHLYISRTYLAGLTSRVRVYLARTT